MSDDQTFSYTIDGNLIVGLLVATPISIALWIGIIAGAVSVWHRLT